jgi:ComF family protein
MKRLLSDILRHLRDFIYPPVCFVCYETLNPEDERICQSCWGKCPVIDRQHSTYQFLRAKFDDEGSISDVVSCFLFEKEGVFQEIIHLFKYRGMKTVGVRLGTKIGEKMIAEKFPRADYLIPVPLHRRKKRERGYNQSECICNGISHVTGIPVNASLIRRIKDTQSQTQLNLEQRKENVNDAFQIDPSYLPLIQDKIFILVDDVMTTGATIQECARVLLQFKAKKVFAASAALAA